MVLNSKKADISLKSGEKATEVASVSSANEVAAFLQKANQLAQMKPQKNERGRLIFALDATLSRQHTWDLACHIQAEMFEVVESVGGLDVQLNYFRGFRECRSSPWVSETTTLHSYMGRISCRGGKTQIKKVLLNALREQSRQSVDALVFIGDAAHCSSPQLGQGINMSLVDAVELVESLQQPIELDVALKRYARRRRTWGI